VALERLIEQLSLPRAYPYATERVDIRQTHLSLVFLAGDCVYKVKKPVKFGFLDFTTLDARRTDCLNEVRHNRRLAPHVYLGVVPIVEQSGELFLERQGEAVEWAVKMRRLPDDASLLAKLERGKLSSDLLERVAGRLAAFHAAADRSPAAAELAGFAAVARNARENFDEVAPDVGVTVSQSVLARLRERTEVELARLAPLIGERARRGVACDGHGDLRLEHIYTFSDAQPPDDLVVIDCIEFNDRFRLGDPVGDIAFTVMELLFHGRADLARSLADAYFRSVGEDEGKALLGFYVAYRSVVRAKVRGLELREREIPEERRATSLAKSKAHFLLALGALEEPELRPLLVLIGGLPGTGKSTLARGLAEQQDFCVIRSDVVRKELAGVAPDVPLADGWRAGWYAPEWTLRTFAQCQRRAEALLFEGERVIVDASFADEAIRLGFLRAARSLSVPVVWFVCRASAERVRQRLAARRGDASDADWAVYEGARRSWDPEGGESAAVLVEIDTEPGVAAALGRALSALRERNFA